MEGAARHAESQPVPGVQQISLVAKDVDAMAEPRHEMRRRPLHSLRLKPLYGLSGALLKASERRWI